MRFECFRELTNSGNRPAAAPPLRLILYAVPNGAPYAELVAVKVLPSKSKKFALAESCERPQQRRVGLSLDPVIDQHAIPNLLPESVVRSAHENLVK